MLDYLDRAHISNLTARFLKGIVQHFGKCLYRPAYGERDERIDTKLSIGNTIRKPAPPSARQSFPSGPRNISEFQKMPAANAISLPNPGNRLKSL